MGYKFPKIYNVYFLACVATMGGMLVSSLELL